MWDIWLGSEQLVLFRVVPWLALNVVIGGYFELISCITVIELLFIIEDPLDGPAYILVQFRNQ
jgi:hypothetical protein